MTWFRSDDDLPDHVKADALEAACAGDWALLAAAWMTWHHMGCDCAKRRTDGHFTLARAQRFVRLPPDVVARVLPVLELARFLDHTPEGWVFHDWTDYQPTKAELDEDRKANAARQSAWRIRQKAIRAEKERNAVTNTVTNGVADGVTNAARNGVESRETGAGDEHAPRNAPPSRPVPSNPKPEEGDARGAGAAALPAPTPPAAGADSPPGVPPSAVHPAFPAPATPTPPEAPKKARKARAKAEPVSDTIPFPGTPARAIYEAVVNDAALRPITGNPGDFAQRVSDPAIYPGVNVLAEIKQAGLFASGCPGKYTDGRAYLRGWLQRKARDAALVLRPATASVQRPAVSVVRPADPVVSAEDHERNRAAARAARERIERKANAAD